MRIALTQREVVLENTAGQFVFDALERVWYDFLQGHDLVTIPNLLQKDFGSLGMDCLLITGGPDSYARHMTEDFAYAWAVANNIPIVGICHGAFVINDLGGGKNGRCEGHHGTTHTVTMASEKAEVNSYHTQCIDSIGPDFQAEAWDDDGRIEAFSHRSLPIHAIVWHPERQTNPVLTDPIKRLLGL
jgi:putative glutamine amidotransferase